MAFNKFSAGRKVYSSGSFAPTRGTVNPSGYIKRELKKRAKTKGKATQAKSSSLGAQYLLKQQMLRKGLRSK